MTVFAPEVRLQTDTQTNYSIPPVYVHRGLIRVGRLYVGMASTFNGCCLFRHKIYQSWFQVHIFFFLKEDKTELTVLIAHECKQQRKESQLESMTRKNIQLQHELESATHKIDQLQQQLESVTQQLQHQLESVTHKNNQLLVVGCVHCINSRYCTQCLGTLVLCYAIFVLSNIRVCTEGLPCCYCCMQLSLVCIPEL